MTTPEDQAAPDTLLIRLRVEAQWEKPDHYALNTRLIGEEVELLARVLGGQWAIMLTPSSNSTMGQAMLRIGLFALLPLTLLTNACAPKPDPAHPPKLVGAWRTAPWHSGNPAEDAAQDAQVDTLVLSSDGAGRYVTWSYNIEAQHDEFTREPLTWTVRTDSTTGRAEMCLVREGIGLSSCASVELGATDTLTGPTPRYYNERYVYVRATTAK